VEVVFATANAHKASEINEILAPEVARGLVLLPRPETIGDVEEDGETLEDNARLKAVAIARATGRAAVADDTGLFIDALAGEPGVRSARYAGEDATFADNVALVLERLGDTVDRRARFTTVALLVLGPDAEIVATGTETGTIATEPRGAAGFGYDAVFIPDEGDGRTFAEMTQVEKAGLSHRGRAFRALASELDRRGLLTS
jgi:XTP/dITP diphosphohydrolase